MKIHFVGIGGIGVSALAQYYLAKGHQVSGSDLNESEMTQLLKKKGVKVRIGPQDKTEKSDLLIHSPAVQEDNPELRAARNQGIKCQSYPEALGELTKKYFCIAVCGTHGKSTTTSMIALILIKAGLDPTVIVGTRLNEFGGSNFRMGKSKYLVIEADEWQASFLNYWPKVIVLTNIEREHLDYYKDLEHIRKTFKEFISHLPKDGILISNRGYQIDQKLKQILKIPGKHNITNAGLALSISRYLKIPDKIAYQALSEYQGTWRRFEIHNGHIVSDYAHHPTEIRATLQAVREKWPKKQVWLVFQPHQYQRTFYLFDDFVKIFKKAADNKVKVIITDIYDVAGRETGKIKAKVSAKKMVEAVGKTRVIYLKKEQICQYLKQNLQGSEIIVIMGAGDIYELVDKIARQPGKGRNLNDN